MRLYSLSMEENDSIDNSLGISDEWMYSDFLSNGRQSGRER